ncbi:MAG: monooxygenase [Actinomycetota bacterium]
MIVTVVRFRAPTEPGPALTVDQARERFGANATSYLDVPGLLWKAYLLAEDGRTVGGTYWWVDRASAEAKFNDGWRAGVTEKYGAAPTIEWFEAPVVVDARFDMVRVEAPPARVATTTEPEG